MLLNINKHFVCENKSSYNFCLRQAKEKYRLLNVFSCEEWSAASMFGAEMNGPLQRQSRVTASGCCYFLLHRDKKWDWGTEAETQKFCSDCLN